MVQEIKTHYIACAQDENITTGGEPAVPESERNWKVHICLIRSAP